MLRAASIGNIAAHRRGRNRRSSRPCRSRSTTRTPSTSPGRRPPSRRSATGKTEPQPTRPRRRSNRCSKAAVTARATRRQDRNRRQARSRAVRHDPDAHGHQRSQKPQLPPPHPTNLSVQNPDQVTVDRWRSRSRARRAVPARAEFAQAGGNADQRDARDKAGWVAPGAVAGARQLRQGSRTARSYSGGGKIAGASGRSTTRSARWRPTSKGKYSQQVIDFPVFFVGSNGLEFSTVVGLKDASPAWTRSRFKQGPTEAARRVHRKFRWT